MAIAIAAFVVMCSFVTIALALLVIRQESSRVELDDEAELLAAAEEYAAEYAIQLYDVQDQSWAEPRQPRSWPEPRHMAVPGKHPTLRTRRSR